MTSAAANALLQASGREGVLSMASQKSSSAGACCFREKQKLADELSNCCYCSTSFEEYKRCKQSLSRESGERAKSCMIE